MSVNWKDPCIWRPWLKRERRLRNKIYAEKQQQRRRRLDNPTPAEERLYQLLLWHFPQYYFEREAEVNGYYPDFYFPRFYLDIEVDGFIHESREAIDKLRDNQLANCGVQVLRFSNDDVFRRPSYVINEIRKKLRY